MIKRTVTIGFDFNGRNINRLLLKVNTYSVYAIYIVAPKIGKVNIQSVIGLMFLKLKKGDVVELLTDAPDYLVDKIINIFQVEP